MAYIFGIYWNIWGTCDIKEIATYFDIYFWRLVCVIYLMAIWYMFDEANQSSSGWNTNNPNILCVGETGSLENASVFHSCLIQAQVLITCICISRHCNMPQYLNFQSSLFCVRWTSVCSSIALWVRLNVKWEIGKCLPRPSF